jgi:hypothetical protein
LKKWFGEKGAYEVGDELADNEMHGSLASDLADLYFKIKRGLDLIQHGRENLPASLSQWHDVFFSLGKAPHRCGKEFVRLTRAPSNLNLFR